MPLVYLVIDHWTPFVEELYRLGIRKFFVTDLRALGPALERGCDVIVDNGAYRSGSASFGMSLFAARRGLKYILPDVVGDPDATVEMHARFAEMVSERELANGFVVLQGATFEECERQLEKLRELGIVKRFVAFGGPKHLRRRRREDEMIVKRLYSLCRRYGYWFHVLGRARSTCDSFDTASWAYRMLEQKLNGKPYTTVPIIDFVKRYEQGRPVPTDTLAHFEKE